MKIRPLIAICCLFLTACTSQLKVRELPAQQQPLRLFKVENQGQNSLLSVQFEPTQWRFVQTDALGSPQARVLLSQNGWANDGFIMPNAQARRLFSALAVALNPDQPPFIFERRMQTAKGHVFYDKGKMQFEITPTAKGFSILLNDGSQWQIDELSTD